MRSLFLPLFVLTLMLVGCSGPPASTTTTSTPQTTTPPPAQPAPSTGPTDIYPHTTIDEKPGLIGGLSGLAETIRYPEIARKAGVSGTVEIHFTIHVAGIVTEPMVARGIGAGCDEEALRAVRDAKFEPGRQQGRRTSVPACMAIMFNHRDTSASAEFCKRQ